MSLTTDPIVTQDRSNSPELAGDFRVICVLGSGRSGSTIFDIALGSHSDVCAVGELNNLPQTGWIDGDYCACGSSAKNCKFWGEVLLQWTEITQGATVGELVRLQEAVETNSGLMSRYLGIRRDDDTQFGEYARLTEGLYRAISSVSGKSVIVDSSKAPRRAMALSHIPSLNVRFIHLVRDVRGVAWSLKKSFAKDLAAGLQNEIVPKPVLRTAAFWMLVNLLAEIFLSTLNSGDYCRLRYEDFVEYTDAELRSVSSLAGLDFGDLARALKAGEPLTPGHTVAGNRVRMSGEIRLRVDKDWMQGLNQAEKNGLWMAAGLLLKRYGYGR